MPIRSILSAAALGAALFLPLAAASPAAQAYDCETEVNEALQQHGISQSDVESVELMRRSAGAKSSSNYSYNAWARLKSCSNGHVVVNLTKYCMLQQVYTTGDCEIGQMPNY